MMEDSLQTVRQAIDAHGLGYAIQTGGLTPEEVSDEKLSQLIKVASDAMREIERMVR